jgi:hypothetical protein
VWDQEISAIQRLSVPYEVSPVNQIPGVLLAVIAMIGILILGGVLAEPITAVVHRYFPSVSYEGERWLLWGGFAVAAFGLGLLVMYLLLRP